MYAVSISVSRFLAFAAGISLLIACSNQNDVPAASDGTPLPVTMAKAIVRTMADPVGGNAAETCVTPEAEIVDIVDGGNGGEWAAIIKFRNGIVSVCVVEVADKTGQLLARDEVNPEKDGEAVNHNIRFRYGGSVDGLLVRVTDQDSGSIIAEFPEP